MKKQIKFCKNPDCEDEILDYKSSKRKYCSDKCRNYHGHKRRTKFNLEFTIYKNGMVTNYKVLKFLSDAGILKEKLDRIIRMGFDPKYLPQKNIDNEFSANISYYIIKNITFGLDPDTDEVIIFSNKKINNEE
jgi:6-pyruvoyl-tetrahydropterin synthase